MGSKTTIEFKIGDRIKIISEVFWIDTYFTNKKGVIVQINDGDSFPYDVKIDNTQIPVFGYEIEPAFTKGQQLLFSFMK